MLVESGVETSLITHSENIIIGKDVSSGHTVYVCACVWMPGGYIFANEEVFPTQSPEAWRGEMTHPWYWNTNNLILSLRTYIII